MQATASCFLDESATASPTVTQLLREVKSGDQEAMNRVFPIVYPELRRLADMCLRRERSDHTLQRTALVHEAYLRLAGGNQPHYDDRGHFLRIAGRVMRQILVDHARKHNAGKRDGGVKLSLDETLDIPTSRDRQMMDLDDALAELERRDELKAKLIEMRFFGGLTAEESSTALGMPVADVRRQLRLAQAWIEREMRRKAV